MSADTSNSAEQVAARRVKAQHTSMFLRMLVRAAVLRRGRAASALLAMVVAAAVTTAAKTSQAATRSAVKGSRNYPSICFAIVCSCRFDVPS